MKLHEYTDKKLENKINISFDVISEEHIKFLESAEAKSIVESYIGIRETLKDCIDKNDIYSILFLEHKAQCLDDEIFGKEQKRLGFRAALVDIKNELVRSSDINFVKEFLTALNDNKTLPNFIPDNMPAFKHLNQLKAEATHNVSRVKSEDYKEYFRTRHDALQAVHVEIKNKYRLALGMKPQKHIPRHQKKENELER